MPQPDADPKPELRPADTPGKIAPVAGAYVSLHAGPLPSPETMLDYEALIPGYPKQLAELHIRSLEQSLRIQQSEVEHRQQLERAEQVAISTTVATRQEIERRGQMLGALVSVIALVVCGYFAWLGYATQAAAFGLAVPVALLTALLYGRRKRPEPPPAP